MGNGENKESKESQANKKSKENKMGVMPVKKLIINMSVTSWTPSSSQNFRRGR